MDNGSTLQRDGQQMGSSIPPLRPGLLRVSLLTVCVTAVSLALTAALVAGAIFVSISSATWDALTDLPSAESDTSADLDRWVEQLTDALADNAGSLALAATIPPLIVWVLASIAYVMLMRIVFGWRLGLFWALLSVFVGTIVGSLGFLVDALLVGTTFGLIGIISIALVVALMLRAGMKPPRRGPLQ